MKNLLTICLFYVIHQIGYAKEYIVANMTELQNAHNASLPGDIITLRGGDYPLSGFTIDHSGSVTGGYITYQNFAGETPKLIGQPTSNYTIINIKASYIRFTGIEIQGINQYCTQAEAEANYVDYFNTSPNKDAINKTSCNGISIGSTNDFCHHVEIKNCIVHDNPGQGIGCRGSDFITFEHNTVYNNCFYAIWATSGISVAASKDLDSYASDATSTKIYIIRNLSYNNVSKVPYVLATGASKSVWKYSDGNGIIIDTNTEKKYKGAALVANNVSYNNGGAGINIFSSNNVSVHYNSTYNNGLWSTFPEFLTDSSKNLYVYNNIFYAKNGGTVNKISISSSNVYFDYNIYCNGQFYYAGANDKQNTNPLYNSPTTGNLKLQSGSPAINTATPFSWITNDIDNKSRPINGVPDRGAYEYSASGGRIGTEEIPLVMQVRILGNPVAGDKVDLAVSGIEGQPLRLQLTDIQGRVVTEFQTSQAAPVEQCQLAVGQRSGILLLQISTPGQRQTIKLVKQ